MAHAASKRDAAALELAGGKHVSAVAASQGIGERTLRRWLAEDEEFQAQVSRLRVELFQAATGRLCLLSGNAAMKLGALLNASSESVQLGAARCILETAGRLLDLTELAERLANVEEQMRNAKKEPRVRSA